MSKELIEQHNPYVLFATGAIIASLDDVKNRLWNKMKKHIPRESFDKDFKAAVKLAVKKVQK